VDTKVIPLANNRFFVIINFIHCSTSGPTFGLAASGGTGETPSQSSRHFWQNVRHSWVEEPVTIPARWCSSPPVWSSQANIEMVVRRENNGMLFPLEIYYSFLDENTTRNLNLFTFKRENIPARFELEIASLAAERSLAMTPLI
jgi:hypothetical protein